MTDDALLPAREYRDCRRPAEPIEVTEGMGWF